jgi:hypothetical protein
VGGHQFHSSCHPSFLPEARAVWFVKCTEVMKILTLSIMNAIENRADTMKEDEETLKRWRSHHTELLYLM